MMKSYSLIRTAIGRSCFLGIFLAAAPVAYAAPPLGLAVDGVSGVLDGVQAQLPALDGIAPTATGLLNTIDGLESLQQLDLLMPLEGLMELELLQQSVEQNIGHILQLESTPSQQIAPAYRRLEMVQPDQPRRIQPIQRIQPVVITQ